MISLCQKAHSPHQGNRSDRVSMETRRGILKLLASGALASGGSFSFSQLAAQAATVTPSSLIPYGAALYLPDLKANPKLGQVIASYCQRVTPVAEMKWDLMRPSPTAYEFGPADAIADFARSNRLAMHGHPLIWYASNAPWIDEIDSERAASRLMHDHIATVMPRYRDVVPTWDVVNEPIPDNVHRDSDRREAWYNHIGPKAIGKAFELAHAADPNALLILNEYDIEFAAERSPMKLKAYRRLILELLDQGAPIGGIGLQGHLRGNWPIATEELSAFTSEMRSLGLKVLVTELDVMDHELKGDEARRDANSLQQVRDFLTAASAGGPLHSITTWGISDQYTWIRWAYRRKDGASNRPLPLDWNFQEKPMMALINEFRKSTLK